MSGSDLTLDHSTQLITRSSSDFSNRNLPDSGQDETRFPNALVSVSQGLGEVRELSLHAGSFLLGLSVSGASLLDDLGRGATEKLTIPELRSLPRLFLLQRGQPALQALPPLLEVGLRCLHSRD